MSERKAIGKYKPLATIRQHLARASRDIRVTTPFTMTCDSCGDHIGKDTGMYALKETTNERYLGSIFLCRFYIHCPRCKSEIIYRTDPQYGDYQCESGARRGLRRQRESEVAQAADEASLHVEAEHDWIYTLQMRVNAERVKLEDISDALDEASPQKVVG